MSIEDVKKVMQKVCPDMLSNDNFMQHTVNKYCNGEFCNAKALNDEEYDAWCKLREVIGTATVGQVIKHLKENFKPTDQLCYMDCVEGCKNDCTYVTKDQLGKRFFYYMKDLKRRVLNETGSISKKDLDGKYPYVQDEDVVVC